MRRIRIDTPKVPRERSCFEPVPLDPRDPDVVRVKSIDRARHREIDRQMQGVWGGVLM